MTQRDAEREFREAERRLDESMKGAANAFGILAAVAVAWLVVWCF